MERIEKAQEIFRRVIDAGLYHGKECFNEFMCHALSDALEEGVITEEENELAVSEIKECIARGSSSSDYKPISLGGVIWVSCPYLAREDGNYTEIYWNWVEKRPF